MAEVASESVANDGVATASTSAALRAPYPGLRSFHHDESDLFFGREEFVTTLVDRLAATRFLALLGLSGTGKSSVVRTGLLDSLELGLMGNAGSSWRIADFRPGSSPLQNLADALLAGDPRATPSEREGLRDFLARSPRAVIAWCRDGNLPAGTNLLLLADQFEELFRYQDYAKREETQALVELLLESAHSPEFPIYVIITMRSEYLGACVFLDDLAEAIGRGMVLIPRLTRDQCRTAIVGPAEVCGIKTDPPMVNALLNDMGAFAPWDEGGSRDQLSQIARRADQLPLMQHALNQMWKRASLRRKIGENIILQLADYRGLERELDYHAEEVYQSLEPSTRLTAEKVFRALTVGTTVANATRRPTQYGDLVGICGANSDAAVAAVIAKFGPSGCQFLTSGGQTGERFPDRALIDIAHESLIRQWKRLSNWLEKEGRAAQEWQRLAERAERKELLLTTRRLADARRFRKEIRPTPAWAARYGGDFDAIDRLIKWSAWLQRGLLLLVIAVICAALDIGYLLLK
jgi:hypothetical protein